MIEADEPRTSAYSNLAFQSLLGATPAFAWAGARVSAQCTVPREQRPALWDMACQILAQIARTHEPFARWAEHAAAAKRENAALDPLGLGWHTLLAALGAPEYPWQAALADPGAPVWHTAFPYADVAKLGLILTSDWLNRSYLVLTSGELTIRRAQLDAWSRAFAHMTDLLPSPASMALHHRLWQRGIVWESCGDGMTRIGQGNRQMTVDATVGNVSVDVERWRVPIYTVTGSIGKTTTVRLLSQLLKGSGARVALTASDGAWIGDTRVVAGDCIGGKTARALLQNPLVEAAVFEQGRGGLLHQGTPYAHSDVGVLLNVDAVHLGIDGINTIEEMATIKAQGLAPARIAVLNLDDIHCRRIGAARPRESCVWISTMASDSDMRERSLDCLATAGVARTSDGQPVSLVIWVAGKAEKELTLAGVEPYHGMLGEKTLEELLAAVCAAWFGPLDVTDWDLSKLRLDSENHLFRTSVHYLKNTIYVLDKAGEGASLKLLGPAVEQLADRENVNWRIAVFARSAGEPPENHLHSAQVLYPFMDEFVCFDRPQSYTLAHALPMYQPGSIPVLLRDELQRLNDQHSTAKPIAIPGDWGAAEAFLQRRLAELGGKTLVLINQPATSSYGLNERIVAFIKGRPIPATGGPE